MIGFTLITEGGTDQEVLINILSGYFDSPNSEKLFFNISQPIRSATENKALDPGGWREVLKYCASEEFKLSLETAEVLDEELYHIIQIDSDVSEDVPFSVPKKVDLIEYVEDIRQRLIQEMTIPVYQAYANKIFFAICVDRIECWLIPLHDGAQSLVTVNCKEVLQTILANKGQQLIKGIKGYSEISKDYKNRQTIIQHFSANPSLKIFLSSLQDTFNVLQLPNP